MKNFVITIERGFGSGGKSIGMAIAEKLGIKYYDEEILRMASDESGIDMALFRKNDERISDKMNFPFFGRKGVFAGGIIPPDSSKFASEENLFNYQARVLRNLAAKESFIAIGRASNHVLADLDNVFSFCFQAPFDVCTDVVMERYVYSKAEAEKEIRKIDKERGDFYYYYTGKKWNDPVYYDLTFNTGKVSWEKCADIIIAYIEERLGEKLV